MTEYHRLIKSAKSARDRNVTEDGEIPEAISRFDQAAKTWGWQEDQGYDGDAISASIKEYDSANVALYEAFDRAILAEREACAKIAEARHSYPIVKLEWNEDGGRHETPAGIGGPGADIADAIRRR